MKLKYLIPALSLCVLNALGADHSAPKQRNYYNQMFLGTGSSIKGFGDTDQEVRTLDVLFRHARVFYEKDEGWLKGSHEFWIETPMAVILNDTDEQDHADAGMIGLNFLAAWIFPETMIGSPYFMIGGGPQYVFADIEGVGSDICGNYQLGAGTRFMFMDKHEISLEIRYHHISNLDMWEPNVPLNSVKFYIGGKLPL